MSDKKDMEKTAQNLKIMREVSVQADNNDFYNRAKELGEIAARVLREQDENKHRSQITKLENIANNAMKVTDIINYLKKQTAKAKSSESWKAENLGSRLIGVVEFGGILERWSQQICTTLSLTDPADKQHNHLLFIREFVRQLAAQYEWKVNQ